MGFPSNTFSSATAGRLEVHFTAEFTSSTSGGPDWVGGSASFVIKCTVTDASSNVSTSYLTMTSPTATLVLDYPGGSVAWTVAMAHVSHSIGGTGSLSCDKPTITCILVKR